MAFLLDKKNQAKKSDIKLWVGVIIVSIVFSIFFTVPSLNQWLTLRASIESLNEINLNFEDDISRKTKQLEVIEEEFTRVAKDFLEEEESLFPENININNIARVLELYSIQYSLIDSTSTFNLKSISFSTQSTENYAKTSINLSVGSTEDSLKDFIYFIQNNELPEKLINAQSLPNSLIGADISTVNFLRRNRLPIANIESIVSTKEDENDNNSDAFLNTDIQINFFSQKINNE